MIRVSFSVPTEDALRSCLRQAVSVFQFSSEMLANCVLLHVLSTLTLVQLRSRSREGTGRPFLTICSLFHSMTWLILGVLLWSQDGSAEAFIEWRIPTSTPESASGILNSISFRFDFVSWPFLVILPLATITCCWQNQSSHPAASSLSFLMLGATVLIVSNDVLTLMAGAAFVSLSLIPLAAKQGGPVLRQQTIGWFWLFAGLAWLVACAAFVRSAPHGLPGASTTILSDLTSLIQRSTDQHPAADFLWKQYQLLPALSILLGIGFLSGLVPFHTQIVQLFEDGSLQLRVGLIIVSKVALLLAYKILIQPDPGSWLGVCEVLEIPALLGLVYTSFLLMANSSSSLRLARLVVWSQHVTLFLLVTTPELGMIILLLSSLTQFAALILLSLREELIRSGKLMENHLAYGLIGVSMLAITSGGIGNFLLWQASLPLSTESPTGASRLVLFALSLLISITGLLRFLQKAEPPTEQTEKADLQKFGLPLLAAWSGIAISSSFAILIYAVIGF